MSWWKTAGSVVVGGAKGLGTLVTGGGFEEAVKSYGQGAKYFDAKKGTKVETVGDVIHVLRGDATKEEKKETLHNVAMSAGTHFITDLMAKWGLDNWFGEQGARLISEYLAGYVEDFLGPMLGLGPDPTPEQMAAAQAQAEKNAATKLEKMGVEAGIATPLADKMTDPNMVEEMSRTQAKEAYADMAVQNYQADAKDAQGNFIHVDANGDLISKEQFCALAEAKWEEDNPEIAGQTYKRVVSFDEYYEKVKDPNLSPEEAAVAKQLAQNKYNANMEAAIGNSLQEKQTQINGPTQDGQSLTDAVNQNKEDIFKAAEQVKNFDVSHIADLDTPKAKIEAAMKEGAKLKENGYKTKAFGDIVTKNGKIDNITEAAAALGHVQDNPNGHDIDDTGGRDIVTQLSKEAAIKEVMDNDQFAGVMGKAGFKEIAENIVSNTNVGIPAMQNDTAQAIRQ